MAVDQGHIAGFYYAQYATRNSAGYPMGQDSTPNAVTALDVKNALLLTGPVSVTAPSVTRERATFRGGQKALGQRSLGVSDFGTFELTLSAYDELFHTLISGGSADTTTATSVTITAPNSNNGDLPTGMLLLTQGFTTDAGAQEFITWIYHNVQIEPTVPGATQSGGENPNPLTYTVIPNVATRTGFGMPFSSTGLAVTDNSDICVALRGADPFALTTYIDDGSATSFVVGYRPNNAEHAGAYNIFTKNGATAHTAVSGVNTTSGAITITAGSANDIWVALYASRFVAI